LLLRVARLFPAYYVQLAVFLGGAYLLGQASPISNLESFLRHLFMLFVPPPVGIDPINTVWWTLPIEFMFYLTLPFLAGLINPKRWLLLLILMLTSMWLWRAGTIIYIGPGNFLKVAYLHGCRGIIT
jgi:peptidoglycan/LPS O-acetylase OafA/YrhL